MADQRLLTVQFRGGLLHQFRQVQKIGQYALAITALHQGLRQMEVVKQAAQHRQHALFAPQLAIAAELHDPGFPDHFVLIQALQLDQWQVKRGACQRGLERTLDIGFGASLQPGKQVMRLLRGEDRVLVREINTAYPAGGEFAAYGLSLFTVADEDRDVRRTQTSEVVCLNKPRAAGLPAIEQCGGLAGAGSGHLLAIDCAGQRLIARQ